jgi:DNA polymerase III sliding clamp (beta) subunit (PCNA family)
VVCGSQASYIADGDWIGEKTPLTLCDVRVSPSNTVKPNIGASELAEALNRVLPFTARDDSRPVLQCVNLVAKDGKLTLISADGFRLAVVALDYEDGEGQALINADDIKGIANALRRAKRVRISFEPSGESLDGMSVIVDTELTRYKWTSVNGQYPDWQKLIPTEFNTYASFDTVEAVKAVGSLKALSDNPKAYPIDLTIGNGKMVMSNPDDKGVAELPADTDGEGYIRVEGKYLADALKASGGMVELKTASPTSPMLFANDGFQLVVMPMISEKAKEAEKQAEPAEATATTEAEPAEGEAEAVSDEQTEGITDEVAEEPTDEQAEPEPVGAGSGGKHSRKQNKAK